MARLRTIVSKHLLALSCCATLQLAAQTVAADSSPADRETARSLMAEGDRLRAAGDLRGAMARYQGAHAIMHVPTTGLDLARVQAQLGLLVEARSTAMEVIHSPVAQAEPQVFSEARKATLELANQLEDRVPALKTEVQPATASYSANVDGFEIPAQVHGLAYKLNPGPHTVLIDAPGYATETRQITLNDGETQTLSVVLRPLPPSADPRPQPGTATLTSSTVVQPTESAERDLRARASAGTVRGIIGLSVGGVALVLGSVTGILSLSQASDVKRNCNGNQCAESERSTLSSANTLANVANISLPLGVIGVAYGLYELLTVPSTAPSAEHARALRFDVTGTGVMLRGTL